MCSCEMLLIDFALFVSKVVCFLLFNVVNLSSCLLGYYAVLRYGVYVDVPVKSVKRMEPCNFSFLD